MGEFVGIVNRTVAEPGRDPYIQVKHRSRIHRVEIVTDPSRLQVIKSFDDSQFSGFQGIELPELKAVADNGRVLALRREDGELAGESQILLSSIPWHTELQVGEAYCYGTAVSKEVRGQGVAQILYKAQEITAREAGKTHLSLTVRPENGRSLRARLRAGYRVVGYDAQKYGPADEGGARALMVRDLEDEPVPYAPDVLMRRLAAGNIPVIDREVQFGSLDLAVPITIGDKPDLEAQAYINELINGGYIGIGLLRPDECGGGSSKSLLVFHQQGKPMGIDRPHWSPRVTSDFSKLREVVVGYPRENSQITSVTAINAVAEQNVGNMDAIAKKDEFIDFVDTLKKEGVRIVRTHAEAPAEYKGNSGIFTRDPAFVIGGLAIIGKLGRAPRQYETAAIQDIFQGLKVLDLSAYPDVVLEGGDVIPLVNKTVLVGIGQRTNENGLRLLRRMLPGYDIVEVRHKELHLDVLFNKVARKKALAEIRQLPSDFLEYIDGLGIRVVISDPRETQNLGNNVLAIDEDKVIAVKENTETNRRLREAGVEVIEVSMPNIIKGGGGPRCITCPVHRE